ncbi:ParB/RepB/Spo0J family partition protein [Pseudonocardia endophytica]|uniref:ParB family chromosome partitioning protein n=1 Tax=Pseudonocardia endophytica TaxID=401976 RepID=A0A4R1I182_PSEEN|nr:ParB/RepB/Spo0J family partition protein [Pseudonocardia endophytica]TCK27663.1 ParB family chromosome partitioning protein [Pseudonocardia endophytica]
MPERKGGLGRGLAALIPTGPVENGATARPGTGVASPGLPATAPLPSPGPSTLDSPPDVVDGGAEYREIPVSRIVPNPQQPRTQFDEEQLGELEHSIREFGLLQPIVVRANGSEYELIMGERRWRAAQRAGLEVLPAIVRHTGDDAMLRDALLENIHRVQLNPLEEAAAYEQLLAEFGVTHNELADRIGRSRPVVTNMIRLLRLPVAVQRRVAAGVLSAGHARALLGLEDAGQQEDLAGRIVAEGMSVRATEEAVVLARQDGPAKEKATRTRSEAPAELTEVADRLSDQFETRVRVELGKRKGRIVVEFGSVEDLERITSMMGLDGRS